MQAEIQGVGRGVDTVQQQQERESKRVLLSRLTSTDFNTTHSGISSRRTKGTGAWLLDISEFRSWMRKDSSGVLWCSGIPGAGKTMLSSLVMDNFIEDRKNDKEIGVAGVYCSYRNSQSTLSTMGSILQQLLEPLDVVPPSGPPKLEHTRAALVDSCTRYSQTFVVIDALDECNDGIGLLTELQEWYQAMLIMELKNTLHITITGRTSVHADHERVFKPGMQLNIRSEDNDVRTFLRQSLNDYEWESGIRITHF